MLLSRPTLARLQSATVPLLAWLAVLAIAAWLGAVWFWRIAAPSISGSIYAPASDPLAAANEISSRHLLGQAAKQPGSTEAAPVATNDLKIVGVMTGSRQSPGFAVIQEEGKSSRAVIEGEELRAGIKLEKVLPQGIQVGLEGRSEIWALTNSQGSTVPPAPVSGLTLPQPVSTPPPPQATPGYSITPGKNQIPPDGDQKPAEKPGND